jgi:hypothetical protein
MVSGPVAHTGYGYPDARQAPVVPVARTNALAVISLVSSLIGWIICVGSIAGIVMGVIALNQIRRNPQAGRGLAIAGIIAGIVGVMLWLILLIIGAMSPTKSST